MTFLYLLPAILSLVTLGAHFYRAANWMGLAFVALLLVLLGVRKPIGARVVPLALLIGVAEWARTAYRIASFRMSEGQPWLRMAVILGAVGLITGLSALPFLSLRLKSWFRVGIAPNATDA